MKGVGLNLLVILFIAGIAGLYTIFAFLPFINEEEKSDLNEKRK